MKEKRRTNGTKPLYYSVVAPFGRFGSMPTTQNLYIARWCAIGTVWINSGANKVA